jgi:hypothetical protein
VSHENALLHSRPEVEKKVGNTATPRIVGDIATDRPLLICRRCHGVGAPVVDMLRALGLGCSLTAVTSGTRESRSGLMDVCVPRRDLIAGIQLTLEKGDLRISAHIPDVDLLLLIHELTEMPLDSGGREHDDLVMALALACWRSRGKSVWSQGRLPGF